MLEKLGSRDCFWRGPVTELSRQRLQRSYYFIFLVQKLKETILKELKEGVGAVTHRIDREYS